MLRGKVYIIYHFQDTLAYALYLHFIVHQLQPFPRFQRRSQRCATATVCVGLCVSYNCRKCARILTHILWCTRISRVSKGGNVHNGFVCTSIVYSTIYVYGRLCAVIYCANNYDEDVNGCEHKPLHFVCQMVNSKDPKFSVFIN